MDSQSVRLGATPNRTTNGVLVDELTHHTVTVVKRVRVPYIPPTLV